MVKEIKMQKVETSVAIMFYFLVPKHKASFLEMIIMERKTKDEKSDTYDILIQSHLCIMRSLFNESRNLLKSPTPSYFTIKQSYVSSSWYITL